MPSFTLTRVESAQDLDSMYDLRYRAYHASGAIPSNPTQRFRDDFDESAHAMCFLVHLNGVAVASTRTLVARGPNRDALTSHRAFAPYLTPATVQGDIVVEGNRMVIDPGHQSKMLYINHALFKAHSLRCKLENAHAFVAGVRVPHVPFYRRSMCMDVVSPTALYPGLNVPMVLMAVNLSLRISEVYRNTPQMVVSDEEFTAFTQGNQLELSRWIQ